MWVLFASNILSRRRVLLIMLYITYVTLLCHCSVYISLCATFNLWVLTVIKPILILIPVVLRSSLHVKANDSWKNGTVPALLKKKPPSSKSTKKVKTRKTQTVTPHQPPGLPWHTFRASDHQKIDTSDTQMVTPLPSRFLVAFSQSTCWRAGKKMGNIAIFTDSLSTLQALNSADPDQMIQGLHSSLAKVTAQFSVSLQWVPAHVGLTYMKKQTDLQKSAVRLRRHRILLPTERPRHFSTLGTMETGRKTTVDIRHTLTQFGDWSGPSRPLSSACAPGIVV